MNDYELVAILNPDIKDEDVPDTVDRFAQFITSRGGEVQNVDQWGRRRLAYPIARQVEGIYVVTHLRLQPANAAELEANLRISEDVLRHLLVRYSPAEQAAAIAASQRRRPRPLSEEQGEDAAGPGEPSNAVSAAAEAPTSEPEVSEPDSPTAEVSEQIASAAPEPITATAASLPIAGESEAAIDAAARPAAKAETATAAIDGVADEGETPVPAPASAGEEPEPAVEAAVAEAVAATSEPTADAYVASEPEAATSTTEATSEAPVENAPAPAPRARTRKPRE